MKRYKYKVIEYEYIQMSYSEEGKKIRVCKTLHKTNSKLFFWLIQLCLKINGIEYDAFTEY